LPVLLSKTMERKLNFPDCSIHSVAKTTMCKPEHRVINVWQCVSEKIKEKIIGNE
jgi:hypothetical protein